MEFGVCEGYVGGGGGGGGKGLVNLNWTVRKDRMGCVVCVVGVGEEYALTGRGLREWREGLGEVSRV